MTLLTIPADEWETVQKNVMTAPGQTGLVARGRMHDADVSASLRLKLTSDGLAHYVGMQNDVLALVRVLRLVVA